MCLNFPGRLVRILPSKYKYPSLLKLLTLDIKLSISESCCCVANPLVFLTQLPLHSRITASPVAISMPLKLAYIPASVAK